MLIDCDTCTMRDIACEDCVVSYLLDRPEGAVVLDLAEERALRELARAGLTPEVAYAPAAEQ
jgi:hypothetical protein